MIGTLQTERTLETRTAPLVHWGAIFAGWLIGNAIMLLLMNFGSAIGLTAINPSNAASMAKGLAAASVAYAFLTWAASFYAGGAIAAWLSAEGDRTTGLLHGLGVWGMAAATTLFVGALVGGIGAAGATGGAAAAANTDQGRSAIASVRQEIGDRLNAATGQTGAGAVEAGAQNPSAVANAALTPDEKAQAAQAADTAKKVSAGALWLTFFAGVTGLVFSALGGVLGSRRLVVTQASRRFEHA